MDPLLMALILGVATVASSLALMALGAYVVKTYPNVNDPARNAKRFTRTAGLLLFVGAFSLSGTIGALITAIAS